MPLSKQQLEVVNQTNFPDNNTQLITPALLRDFNTDIIDSIQLTGSYATTGSNTFVGNQIITGNLNVSGVISASVLYVQTETASVIYSSGSNQFGDELTDIQTLSGSVKVQGSLTVNGVAVLTSSADVTGFVTTASFNSYTSSNNQRVTSLETNSASVNISIVNINTTTASLNTSVSALNSFTQSQAGLNGTFATTGSNTFTGNQVIDRAYKLYTNGIYWTDVTAGFNNLEIINQGGGNLDFASLNGGKMRVVNTPLILTGSALTSSNDISTSANIYGANLTGSALPTGTISSSAQITALGFVSSSVTASSLITASLSGQTLTFTKGNGTTFGIVLPDVSGSDITALNAFTASQLTINSAIEASTASLNTFSASTLTRLTNIETTTASLNSSVTQLNASSASQQISINAINAVSSSWITESETASFARTNVDNNFSANQTFTNITAVSASFTYVQTLYETSSVIYSSGSNQFGDELSDIQTLSGSVKVQGSLTVNGTPVLTSSVDISGLVTTASFNAYTQSNNQRVSSLETNSASVNISISNINSTTASLNTSITNLNLSSASQQVSINSINSVSGSWITESETSSFARTNAQNLFTADQTIASANNLIVSGSLVSLSGLFIPAGILNTSIQFSSANSTLRIDNASLNVDNTLTASLQEGYVWVGNSAGRTTTVSTSSFGGGSVPAGTISSSAQITSLGFVSSSVTASSLITASFSGNTLTFTKGDASTFGVVIPDVSGSAGDFVTTASFNSYTSSNDQKVNSLISATGSYVTSAITASSLVTASVNLNTITFTKGDGTTFPITVNTGSGGGGTTDITSLNAFTASQYVSNSFFATTGSNTFIGNQIITGSMFVYDSGSGQRAEIMNGQISRFPQLYATSLYPGQILDDNGVNILIKTNAGGFTNGGFLVVNTVSGSQFTGSVAVQGNIDITGQYLVNGLPISGGNLSIFATTGSNTFTGNQNILGSLTASLANGFTYVGNSSNISTLVATSSFGSGVSINTGSFATTGSNSFTGIQTFVDGTNFSSLVPTSGSLMLVAKSFTSTSLHLTSSFTNSVNLIFKSNSNTADTIISGSNNIFTNPTAASAGFKRYFGGSGNIAMSPAATPQISGSMGFSPTMNFNFFGGSSGVIMRGPVSSSVWTISSNNIQGGVNIGNNATQHAQGIVAGLTMNTNSILGNIAIVANRTNTSQLVSITTNQLLGGTTTLNMNSSSVVMQNNLIGGTNTINNNTTGSSRVSPAGNAFNFAQNIMMGGNTITASGSNDPNDTTDTDYNANIYRSFILGNSNTIQLQSGITGSNSMVATSVLGNNLIVTGSSPNPQFATSTSNAFGSAFFGRFNSVTGNSDLTAETIFAVGTGNETTRKTGFLIDSGSNTFIEGTLNVSGSTSFTGSVKVASTFQLNLPTGSNQQAGTAVLDGANPGTVTVSNSLVTANSIILLTKQTLNHTNGYVAVSAKSAGSFTITSNHNGDADTVGWFIINNS